MLAANRTAQILPISFLNVMESAKVIDLIGEACCVQRLREIGIREGVTFCMLTPGSTCIIAVQGRRISLRVDCDLEILVETQGVAVQAPQTHGETLEVEC